MSPGSWVRGRSFRVDFPCWGWASEGGREGGADDRRGEVRTGYSGLMFAV